MTPTSLLQEAGTLRGWGSCTWWKLQNLVPRGHFLFTRSDTFAA